MKGTVGYYVPKPDHGALQQIAQLKASGDKADAALIQTMIDTPQAVWFTSGTPKDVEHAVRSTVKRAGAKGEVPVLVAYDVPGRDCSQYSSGGAPTGDAYREWIDGFAAGLGSREAVVILEPDGLALLPTDCGHPDTYGRIGLIADAAQTLTSDSNADVYLDAGHSAWHSVGDIARRLVDAGVQNAAGFFLDVSNYQLTTHETKYGTWISECIAFANNPEEGGWRLGHYDWCASQYYPANPNDFSTWHLTDEWYAANLGHAVPETHFVIDTSRNGQGPWAAPSGHPAGDAQDWCNPPDRGVGIRPTLDTGVPLLDAYLWVKIPGQSDGQCFRWTTGPLDPVRGMEDPPAGQWFPEMALELARNASPPLP
jgi:endoglucanase